MLAYFIATTFQYRLVYKCPRKKCQELFIGEYQFMAKTKFGSQYGFLRFQFQAFVEKVFESEIASLSPNFVEIYNQAAAAESVKLNQICGLGYRKALEFLVKDYLIKKLPEQEAEIKKQFLGKCIKAFLKNERISALAERAVWIGNDEAHYERKWQDKDVKDLKVLIQLVTRHIEMDLVSDIYLTDMAEGKK